MTPTQRIVIRPPIATRIYMVAFGIVWCGLAGFVAVGSLLSKPSPAVVIPMLMFIAGALIFASNFRLRIVAEPHVICVRNFLREQRYPRSDVDRFVDHAPSGLPAALGGGIGMLLKRG